ncbi:MAG TPA: bifunctional lysylphosphatidylglycerol flippase/synthetase MprF, partial [Polyangiaceae bacterium]|nr:bifunctional lysylphosphatidylglycerol flippase/synthetase MprF [Polyangiaceae bacterium]
LYTGWGLGTAEVAALVVFNSLSYWLGYTTLLGVALFVAPAAAASLLPLPAGLLRGVGALLMAASLSLLVANARRRRPWKIGRWELGAPRPALAFGQLLISVLDWSLAALVPFVLLPPGSVPYPAFALTFFLAQVAGLLSHVPGGLGVFEAVMLTALGPRVGVAPLLAALGAFRAIYYLLPLLVAVVLLVGSELLRPERARALALAAGSRLSTLVPPLLAAAVFAAGVVLLMSGATPAIGTRLERLTPHLPLPLLELSHLLASVVGALLLLVARGIQRRQQGAFVLTVALMGIGAASSLLKGLDYEEALVLGLTMLALLPCHRAFYRRASLLDERFTPAWVAAIVVVLAGSVALVVFAHRHTEYAARLWWQFTFDGDAPRSLRAEVGVILVLLLTAMLRLLRPPRLPGGARLGDMERVRPLVARSRGTTASLALLGDKRFLFSADGRSGIMYGVRGRTWVSLGDPIGEEDGQRELIWAFHELCDRHGGWTAFYQVGAERLDIYRDLGLGQFKLGEEARVPLADFSLQGSRRKGLRQSHQHAQRAGLDFELLPRKTVPELLPELRAISADWLAAKRMSEKGFSLGFFDEAYLSAFSLATVRQRGQLLAFANVLEGADKDELSIDLMRHRTRAPNGVMDFLLLELMAWGKMNGYGWFNLGMAPLAGLGSDKLAPLWERAGSLVFRYGDTFYNFEGLRRYKAKFDPIWTPRYLACPGGLALPLILADIAALVAGGTTAIVRSPVRRRTPPAPVAVSS